VLQRLISSSSVINLNQASKQSLKASYSTSALHPSSTRSALCATTNQNQTCICDRTTQHEMDSSQVPIATIPWPNSPDEYQLADVIGKSLFS